MSTSTEKKPTTEKPGVFVKTFGCQMNEYDSEKMLALLASTHRPVDSAEEAEVVIVNTCSVREKAEHKLFSLLGRLRELKDERPQMIIGVGGCVAQQEGVEIVKGGRGVDFVVGTHNLSLIPTLVERAKAGAHSQVAVNYREEWEEIPDEFDAVARTDGRPEVRALVAIQRGCNKNCTYCVVPTTRGAEVSRDPKEIEREVRLKVRGGAREVLLLGQTVNSYGKDLSPRFSFEQLVERLSEIPDLKRIRFTSPHPQDVRQEFIELYGRIPQLVPHIHLPLQSGSDRILKLMNRNYRVRRYREIVGALRERVPQIALTTDIIVGFPTETEEDFLHTLELVHEMRYHSIFSFCYSIRPNTPAQQTYAPEGEPTLQESQSRLQRLQKAQEVISNELNTATVGTTVEVLVEGPTKHISSAWRGRTPQNTLVEVAGEMPALGELVQVKIEYAGPHFLRGRAV